MFTGIIETVGEIIKTAEQGENKSFWIKSGISSELKVDQSLSHNGVCLTVEEIGTNSHKVTAIKETLLKTDMESWKTGQFINLERCLPINGRLDGHLVQGHVDATAVCLSVENKNGSWQYEFEFEEKFAALVIEKGSICINGISLTAFNVYKSTLTVAIIPYTYQHTNMHLIKAGDSLNFEFDLLGKYILRWKELENTGTM